jgi:hypothetical protein
MSGSIGRATARGTPNAAIHGGGRVMRLLIHRPRSDQSAGRDAPQLPMGGSRGEMIMAIAVLVVLVLLVLGFIWQAMR